MKLYHRLEYKVNVIECIFTLALLLITSAAYAGQGMGPGPGARTYVVAIPTLLNFENGLIDSKSNTWSFASGTPGEYGTLATGTLGAFGAGTYHSSSHSVKMVQGAFDDYGEGATDVTEGHITANATIGAGKISAWVKANGGVGRVYVVVDGVFSYLVPDGTDTSGLAPDTSIPAPSDVFTKMVSILSFPAGAHVIDLAAWVVDASPPTPGLITYVDDLELP